MTETNFQTVVEQAGIPANENSIKAAFKQTTLNAGVVFNNDSSVSPFWRVIEALVITPTLWLMKLLIETVLPNAYAKTATGTWLDFIAFGVDIERKVASKAQGKITFTRQSSSGTLTIPKGTRIQSVSINGSVYELQTTADTLIPEGRYTYKIAVEAAVAGAAWNLAAGYYALLPVPIAGVVAVINEADWLTVPGADFESDESLRLRIRNQFSAVNQYHTDAVYRAQIAEFIGISPDLVFFEHNAPRGPGSANAYVLFEAGVPTVSYIDGVNQHIREGGNHGHGDDLMAFAMPETQHDVVLDVYLPSAMDDAARTLLVEQVELMVRTAFRQSTNSDYQPTQTWPYSRFSFSRLAQEIHEQFADIESLAFANNDITSQMNIPRLNVLRVTAR